MPKKLGTNSKADSARDRKFAAEAEKKVFDSREQEERFWKEAEGPKSRAVKKREEEAEKRAEAAARRAENRELAEQELLELEKLTRKPDPKVTNRFFPVSKVREIEREHRRELERLRLESEAEAAANRRSRTVDVEEYERTVLVSNTNRDDDSVIEARSVAEAIAKMAVGDATQPHDRHPERRLKASFMVRVLTSKCEK
ncbi:hypothetical protein KSP40_PGU021261 [Platanthera guangdongensis]|uniref:Coiled-coil domain-containing protein n=1 Tax=Platanthera guangdongensis TaxID=2320717 RepID=A0ABR2MMJ4_9ASPA